MYGFGSCPDFFAIWIKLLDFTDGYPAPGYLWPMLIVDDSVNDRMLLIFKYNDINDYPSPTTSKSRNHIIVIKIKNNFKCVGASSQAVISTSISTFQNDYLANLPIANSESNFM